MKKNRKSLHLRLVGGLGNQLFGYLAGLYLSSISNRDLKLDISGVAKNHSPYDITSFNILSTEVRIFKPSPILNKYKNRVIDSINYRSSLFFENKAFKKSFLVDQGYIKNVEKVMRRGNVKFHSGYFQTFEYLSGLRQQTTFKLRLKHPFEKYEELADKLKLSDSLALHVRRGDFENEKINHGLLSQDWYVQAIEQMLTLNLGLAKVFIFTNDTFWCENVLAQLLGKKGLEVNILKELTFEDPAISFLLFSESKAKVCSNSTFSLLAAAMGSGSVVVPYPYNRRGDFKQLEDTSPQNWLRVESIWEE